MTLLDGKKIADDEIKRLKEKIQEKEITLAIILIGDDPASQIYVRNKKIKANQININVEILKLKDDVDKNTIIKLIKKLNENKMINGIIIQLPLPIKLEKFKNEILSTIEAKKDVDGLRLDTIEKISNDSETFIPATPLGILKLIEKYKIIVKNKKCIIIGKSNLVGKPLGIILRKNGANVGWITKEKGNLTECKKADIIFSAVGKKHIINNKHVKKNAVLFDIGFSRENNKIYGDINFNSVKSICSYITPVPGGVGPMTIYALLENLFNAYKIQNNV